jgi:hypothetical protein
VRIYITDIKTPNQSATPYLLELSIGYRTLPAMLPSEDDIANFIAFAPEAGEGKAFMFLEVRHSPLVILSIGLTNVCLEGGGYHK